MCVCKLVKVFRIISKIQRIEGISLYPDKADLNEPLHLGDHCLQIPIFTFLLYLLKSPIVTNLDRNVVYIPIFTFLVYLPKSTIVTNWTVLLFIFQYLHSWCIY